VAQRVAAGSRDCIIKACDKISGANLPVCIFNKTQAKTSFSKAVAFNLFHAATHFATQFNV